MVLAGPNIEIEILISKHDIEAANRTSSCQGHHMDVKTRRKMRKAIV
jgi:hypothetical protein